MGDTLIEWTDKVWNPTRGCDKVSAGCKHCYAETFAERWRGVPGHAYEQGFDLRLAPAQLALPLRWQKPKWIFVNSMSDLFHEGVPDEYIDQVFGVMWACRYLGRGDATYDGHVFQVLTKRADRMAAYMNQDRRDLGVRWARAAVHHGGKYDPDGLFDSIAFETKPHPRIWLGVSTENQATADERIPHLLATPAAVRFVSAEPLLGPVDLTKLRDDELGAHWNALEAGIGWVIVGGESGPGTRPFDLAWARTIVQQCRAAGVPVFVKQLGADPVQSSRAADEHGSLVNLRSRKGGDPAEWPEDLRVREFPAR